MSQLWRLRLCHHGCDVEVTLHYEANFITSGDIHDVKVAHCCPAQPIISKDGSFWLSPPSFRRHLGRVSEWTSNTKQVHRPIDHLANIMNIFHILFLLNHSRSRITMSNCYCCKQERPCWGGPVNLMEIEVHEGHHRDRGSEKEMWGLGQVVQNCRAFRASTRT